MAAGFLWNDPRMNLYMTVAEVTSVLRPRGSPDNPGYPYSWWEGLAKGTAWEVRILWSLFLPVLNWN